MTPHAPGATPRTRRAVRIGAGAGLVVCLALATPLPGVGWSTGKGLQSHPEGPVVDERRQTGPGEEGRNDSPRPYRRAGEAALEYRGPGREAPEPAVDEVRLGWFGPGDPDHPLGGDFWRGATLALEEANAQGGHGGKPFRLIAAWSDTPWAAGVVEVTRLAYDDGVRALLGATSGASAHLAAQVALKARLPLVSAGSTDKTANMAAVPWFFSCLPSDERQAPALADALERAAAGGPFAIASAAEHDAHVALVELRAVLAARGLTPVSLIEFDPLEPDPEGLVARLLALAPRALLILGPADSAGRLVRHLRRRGFASPVVGGATLALQAFRRAAGEAAEGVVVPRLWEPSPEWNRFAGVYENRWGEPPDHAAAQSYDTVRLLARAVREVGLNRARIGDALRDLAPWPGAAGVIRWDTLGRNQRAVGLATWQGGRLVPDVGPRAREPPLREGDR